MGRNFMDLLKARWAKNAFVCVGLDSEYEKIPEAARKQKAGGLGDIMDSIFNFNAAIVDTTADLVCAYKPNIAFYEAYGLEGIQALIATIRYIRASAPEIPIILDAKRADIGNTNNGYAKMAFDTLCVDAITVHPYLGREALKPFLDRKDKGVIVLCRTSNKGAEEFQDLAVKTMEIGGGDGVVTLHTPLYQLIANHVANDWNENGNCAVVAGATYPEELARIRRIVGDMPILIPGIGTQGGDVEKTVKAGKSSDGSGMIVNSSSGIIFASKGDDFAEAARRETEKLRTLINQYRS